MFWAGPDSGSSLENNNDNWYGEDRTNQADNINCFHSGTLIWVEVLSTLEFYRLHTRAAGGEALFSAN